MVHAFACVHPVRPGSVPFPSARTGALTLLQPRLAAMTETTSLDRERTVLAGLTIAFAVIVPGVLKYLLTSVGFSFLGTLVWALGYGGFALAFWYLFIRPIDLTGPE